jgi:hypothetical protein
MKRSSIFWGSIVVLLGVMLLLTNLRILNGNAWRLFWPLVIVLLGLWFLLGPSWKRKSLDTIQSTIPLEDTTSAKIEFHHGAGRLEVNASARPGELVNGWFTGGVSSEIHRNAGVTDLTLHTPSDVAFDGPWPADSHGYEWVVGLSPEVPLELAFKTGASESVLDLSNLKVTRFSVETGASSTEVTLPANAGFTQGSLKSGMAAMKIHLPAGVGAHVHVQSGLSGIKIDPSRFTQSGNDYTTADYATAANKIELMIESGVGSVDLF